MTVIRTRGREPADPRSAPFASVGGFAEKPPDSRGGPVGGHEGAGEERRKELGVCLFLFCKHVDAVVKDLTNYEHVEISVNVTFDLSYFFFLSY